MSSASEEVPESVILSVKKYISRNTLILVYIFCY